MGSEILMTAQMDSPLGKGLQGANPWRSLGIVLAMLAALFVALWAAKRFSKPFKLQDRSLAVIETIAIGRGQNIVIVEMRDEALVLGVTPHSINLLDKVPLKVLNASYRGTVNEIIGRGRGTARRLGQAAAV